MVDIIPLGDSVYPRTQQQQQQQQQVVAVEQYVDEVFEEEEEAQHSVGHNVAVRVDEDDAVRPVDDAEPLEPERDRSSRRTNSVDPRQSGLVWEGAYYGQQQQQQHQAQQQQQPNPNPPVRYDRQLRSHRQLRHQR